MFAKRQRTSLLAEGSYKVKQKKNFMMANQLSGRHINKYPCQSMGLDF